MKILQICHKIPFPLHDGGSLSLYNNAKGLLNQGIELKVFAIDTPKNHFNHGLIPEGFKEISQFESFPLDTRIKVTHLIFNLFGKDSYFVERFWSEKWNARLIQILKQKEFDIIQLEHSYMGLYINTIRKYSGARIILRPQNAEYQVWERILQNERNPAKKWYLSIAINRLKIFESEIAKKVDGIITISEKDAAVFRKLASSVPIETIAFGIDFSNYEIGHYKDDNGKIPVFYHLGSMDWIPNIQGIKWFIHEILPYIIKKNPGFIFRIAGKNMPSSFYKFQNKHLIVDGTPESSIDYQTDKSVLIIPLLSGGGLRVKIIEGMALGKTIISTTIGAEGIPYSNQENILIANTKEEFEGHVKKCMDSYLFRQNIGNSARQFARDYYDIHQTTASMIRFYKSLL